MSHAPKTNDSRAKEFDLVFSFLNSPANLARFIELNPRGGLTEIEGIKFEYGNIERLVPYLKSTRNLCNPFRIDPKYICHLDTISAERKRGLELELEVGHMTISSDNLKADLFFVDKNNRPYFISVKDFDKPSKLGQVSRDATYGQAHLHGGLTGIEVPEKSSPLVVNFNETGLSERQFKKLTPGNEKLAYFKHNFYGEWQSLVKISESNALDQIREFCEILRTDRPSLLEFIGNTLGGDLKESKNFYVLLGENAIKLSQVLNRLKELAFTVQIEEYTPRKKTSLIIWLEIKDERYCLTKIEASFDGWRTTVSQTKGIIYYFQQHLKKGNHYKKLLLDIAQ